MSSAYLPPPRGTLIGMFNAWVWSLAKVTAKASCTRSPCQGERNVQCFGLVFRFWFTWHVEWSVNLCSLVSAFHKMKILYRWSRLVVSFVSCFLIGSFSWLLIGKSAGNGDLWLVQFPVIWLDGHVQSVWRTKYPVLTLLISLKIVGQQIYVIVE